MDFCITEFIPCCFDPFRQCVVAVGADILEAILFAFECLKEAFESLWCSLNDCWEGRSVEPLESAQSEEEEVSDEESRLSFENRLQFALQCVATYDQGDIQGDKIQSFLASVLEEVNGMVLLAADVQRCYNEISGLQQEDEDEIVTPPNSPSPKGYNRSATPIRRDRLQSTDEERRKIRQGSIPRFNLDDELDDESGSEATIIIRKSLLDLEERGSLMDLEETEGS